MGVQGALDGCTWGHWMGVQGALDVWGHWMGIHRGIGWVCMEGIGRVYMEALDGCTWGHWMGVHKGIGWVYRGCTWGHWMGVQGVYLGHWME